MTERNLLFARITGIMRGEVGTNTIVKTAAGNRDTTKDFRSTVRQHKSHTTMGVRGTGLSGIGMITP